MPDLPRSLKITQATAVEAMARHLATVIRVAIGDDPDHSGPEDAAEKLAERVVINAEGELLAGDWRNLLED